VSEFKKFFFRNRLGEHVSSVFLAWAEDKRERVLFNLFANKVKLGLKVFAAGGNHFKGCKINGWLVIAVQEGRAFGTDKLQLGKEVAEPDRLSARVVGGNVFRVSCRCGNSSLCFGGPGDKTVS
jgi:hypothetical protein